MVTNGQEFVTARKHSYVTVAYNVALMNLRKSIICGHVIWMLYRQSDWCKVHSAIFWSQLAQIW